MTVLLAGDILVGDEVHPVAYRGDEADVGRSVEGEEVFEGDGLVEEVDGMVAWSAC